jgi:23S rRNA (adenine2503-C2)-methyltransferase
MTLLTQPTPADTSQTLAIPLLGQSVAELTEWVQQQGQPAYRGNQLHDWIYQKGARSLSEISVFPKQWRIEMEAVQVGRSTLHHRSPAPDGTVKFLLRLADGNIVETVGIPTFRGQTRANGRQGTPQNSDFKTQNSLSRLTVCVSSQVGCPMACDFCATGKGGFLRNLETHEIVDQVLTVQEDFQQRVSNIVFMGMGEPLLNTEHVLAAVRCLNQDVGIGQRLITISTVGIPGHIRRLADHNLQATLAVSLHAGLNDCPEHAIELAGHLRGFQSHVNLIPYNPIKEVDYKRPDSRRIQAFVDALKAHHIAVSVRRSRGLQADAACGQLRASEMK